MRTSAPLSVVLLAAALGCGGGKGEATPPPSKDLGTATADTANDTAVLRVASGAVNEVVRNAPDCEVARPLIAGAKVKLDEAAPRLRTQAGLATLDALRKQLARVEDLCP